MRELIDGLVQSAQNNGMELYGIHVYRRGEEPVERRLRSDDRENLWSVSKTFVSRALRIAAAGSYFSYPGTAPYVSARALRAATGASVRDYLMPRVFGPLAIHNPQWHTCPLGHPVAESDLFLRTSELARFGRLLLDDGRHE